MKRFFDSYNEFRIWCGSVKLDQDRTSSIQGVLFKGTEYAGDYVHDIRTKKVEVTILKKHIPVNQLHLFQ